MEAGGKGNQLAVLARAIGLKWGEIVRAPLVSGELRQCVIHVLVCEIAFTYSLNAIFEAFVTCSLVYPNLPIIGEAGSFWQEQF